MQSWNSAVSKAVLIWNKYVSDLEVRTFAERMMMKIFEELARENIVIIVNYGVFHGGLNLRCRLILCFWRNKAWRKMFHYVFIWICQSLFFFFSVFLFFFSFFNSFHCIPYNKDNQLIIYSIEFVKAFFLFIVSLTIRIIN